MARTIGAVLDQLAAEHEDHHVYRGQTHRHPMLVPSAVRGTVRVADAAALTLSTQAIYAGLTRRAVEQQRFREALVARLGPGIGALLSQQYGLGSHVIDVTSSPEVAAFFATRRWPTYQHAGVGEGRIYRWSKPDPPRAPAEVVGDAAIGHYVKLTDPSETRVPALPRFVPQSSPESTRPLDEQDGWFILPSTIFTFDEIRAAISDLQDEPTPAGVPRSWMLADIDSSRWAAQRGGFLRPEIRYPARLGTAPDDGFHFEDRADLAGRVLNQSVMVGQPDAITDGGQIGPPEVFDFEHGDDEIRIDPATMWPSVVDDPLFRYCALLAWTTQATYFEKARANTPWDFDAGVLDRGPYGFDATQVMDPAAWDRAEAYQRAEHQVFLSILPTVGTGG